MLMIIMLTDHFDEYCPTDHFDNVLWWYGGAPLSILYFYTFSLFPTHFAHILYFNEKEDIWILCFKCMTLTHLKFLEYCTQNNCTQTFELTIVQSMCFRSSVDVYCVCIVLMCIVYVQQQNYVIDPQILLLLPNWSVQWAIQDGYLGWLGNDLVDNVVEPVLPNLCNDDLVDNVVLSTSIYEPVLHNWAMLERILSSCAMMTFGQRCAFAECGCNLIYSTLCSANLVHSLAQWGGKGSFEGISHFFAGCATGWYWS